jgi:hypothetical protein
MPSIDWMKYALALSLSLGLVSCAAPAPYQKPDADSATMERDTAACRTAAKQYAAERGSAYSSRATGMGMVREDNNRAVAEAASFSSCMRDKGYSNSPSDK